MVDRRFPEGAAVTIIELTSPWEERLETSRQLKTDRYEALLSDLRAAGFCADFIPLEVGVRGIVNHHNKDSIKFMHSLGLIKSSAKAFISSISQKAVLSSYYIFLNRNEKQWSLVNNL